MLAISDLHVAYGQSEVLHGLNVSVAPNEIVAIMGRNGMGKTTLMKSLMGIVPTKSGSVTMEGAELSTLKSYERVAKGLAYVPQGRMIFSHMTVKENIETGLVVSGERNVPLGEDSAHHCRPARSGAASRECGAELLQDELGGEVVALDVHVVEDLDQRRREADCEGPAPGPRHLRALLDPDAGSRQRLAKEPGGAQGTGGAGDRQCRQRL